MKSLILALVALFSFGHAQIVLDGGRTQWGKNLRWGDTDDSTSSIRFRGNTLARDSSSTWVTTTDSCSLPVKLGFTSLPDSKLELSYEVRASSGNTDSTQAVIYVDSRYCPGTTDASCESWVQAGRFRSDSTSRIQDIIYTFPTDAGTTWKPTRHVFDVPGGNQIRFCIDAYQMGGATGDTTFFRSHIIRNSSIPSGGGIASSGVAVSGIAAHDATVSGNPVLIGIEARTSNGTAVANGDVTRPQGTIEGKAITQPYSVRGATWTYGAASGGIVNTTGVTIVSAGGSGIRNCVTSIDIENGHATVSTEVVLRDGASGTVLKRWWTQAAGGGIAKTLPVPVCGTANTLLEVAAITTGSAVYVNAEGYTTQE